MQPEAGFIQSYGKPNGVIRCHKPNDGIYKLVSEVSNILSKNTGTIPTTQTAVFHIGFVFTPFTALGINLVKSCRSSRSFSVKHDKHFSSLVFFKALFTALYFLS